MRAVRGMLTRIATVVAAGVAINGYALTWQTQAPFIATIEPSLSPVSIHPFRYGYSLVQSLPREDDLMASLRNEIHHPLIGIKRIGNTKGFGLTTGTSSVDFQFHVAGVPICLTYARAHSLVDGQTLMLGTVPKITSSTILPSSRTEDWPDLDLSFRNATTSFDTASDMKLKASRRCFFAKHEQLLPAYEFTLSIDGMPWSVWADAYEIFKRNQNFFDLDGTAMVHPQNILSGRPGPVKLQNLTGDGTLTSDYFKTIMPKALPSAIEPSHAFRYDPKLDVRYDEVAAFYYAQRHHDYVQRLGFQWYGPKPLLIKLHVRPAGRANNALFTPAATENDYPSIQIDGGDGIDLQNLTNDADVISHEFGHHVIYQTLRTTEGESLVLHEGLADFFAFAHSGDGCLGESICPANSRSCVVAGQCLRTANRQLYNFDLIYEDNLWNAWAGSSNRLGHLHGQIISGLLWDLRQGESFDVFELARLAMRAVSFLKFDSGFRDFILALFFADQEIFNGKYFKDIYEAASRRGLGSFFEDVSPSSRIIPPISGKTSITTSSNLKSEPAKKPNKTKQDRDKYWTCGSIASSSGSSQSAPLILVLMPLIILFFNISAARAHLFDDKITRQITKKSWKKSDKKH